MDAVIAESRSDFEVRKAEQFLSFLQMMLDALEYSSDLNVSPTEFALSLSDASNLGVHRNDLCWMRRRGWIEDVDSAVDVVATSGSPIDLKQCSRFVLTHTGVKVLNHVLRNDEHASSSVPSPQQVRIPRWNAERHELTLSGRIVKRFRWPAINQEAILNVFEEEGRPQRIYDPLPQGDSMAPKRRLSDTIKCLNRNQAESLVRFRGDGTGEGVLWDLATPDRHL